MLPDGPRNTLASVHPSAKPVERNSVTLACSSDANPSAQTYTWYKKRGDQSSRVGSNQNISFASISSEQSGLYYCEAGNEIGQNRSPVVQISVTYVPKNTSVSVHPSGDIEESDSVTLTCNSDANPPVHNFTWYTNKLGSESAWIGQEQSYNILNISTEHTGSYYCKAENKRGASSSSGTFLDVYYSPRNTLASRSPSGDLQEGNSVNLTCSSDTNPPVHKYIWYRTTGDETVLQGTGRTLNLTLHLVSGVEGLYHCEARNKVGSKNSTGVRVSFAGSGWQGRILYPALGAILAAALLLVVIACWRRQKTNSTKTSRRAHSNTQGDSDPVYDDVSTVPKARGAGQRVAAHHEEEDEVQYASVHFTPNNKQYVPSQKEDVQYASVKFKTNNKQEVLNQEEDIQYASVEFKTNNKQEVPSQEEDIQYTEPVVPEKPSPGTPEEETQYASGEKLLLTEMFTVHRTGDEFAIYSTINKKPEP
ncbi:B-cell receptor CD22-like [Clupea harengus]|uniref:B-cell receptor CD22-like n=1 Tax=Clupea harengus TaxID=7950 RepID=A0A8M1K682_CLUHA|nr:B-cell receptor CD22-like [Clupea harengus]